MWVIDLLLLIPTPFLPRALYCYTLLLLLILTSSLLTVPTIPPED
jgi:hypothetical protein